MHCLIPSCTQMLEGMKCQIKMLNFGYTTVYSALVSFLFTSWFIAGLTITTFKIIMSQLGYQNVQKHDSDSVTLLKRNLKQLRLSFRCFNVVPIFKCTLQFKQRWHRKCGTKSLLLLQQINHMFINIALALWSCWFL